MTLKLIQTIKITVNSTMYVCSNNHAIVPVFTVLSIVSHFDELICIIIILSTTVRLHT